jgi:hypothetical protein
MSDPEELLLTAEAILAIRARHHVDAVVIGAAALAAHHYVRQTDDLDLGKVKWGRSGVGALPVRQSTDMHANRQRA